MISVFVSHLLSFCQLELLQIEHAQCSSQPPEPQLVYIPVPEPQSPPAPTPVRVAQRCVPSVQRALLSVADRPFERPSARRVSTACVLLLSVLLLLCYCCVCCCCLCFPVLILRVAVLLPGPMPQPLYYCLLLYNWHLKFTSRSAGRSVGRPSRPNSSRPGCA